jgi:hypothetical protein
MNVKNTLGRTAGVAVAAVAIAGMGLTSVASASTARPAANVAVHGCSIQTINGHYLTAVDGGGRFTDTIHWDATRVGSWEKFRITCTR